MRRAEEAGNIERGKVVSRGKRQPGQRADRQQGSRCRRGRLSDRRVMLGGRERGR